MHTTRSSGLTRPSCRSRLRPATLAAEAGSQPKPPAPTLAFASSISWSVTWRTTPLHQSSARSALVKLTGRLISIALANVGAGGIDHCEPRPASNKAEFGKLSERLAEAADVAEVSARHQDPVGHFPAQRFEHAEHDR